MPELSIVLPAWNEGDNVRSLLERLRPVCKKLDPDHEVLVVVPSAQDTTIPHAEACGARVVVQQDPGYGGALREGFKAARGKKILTMDADCSHDPHFIVPLWAARDRADIVIASRYVPHGHSEVEWLRDVLSRILNGFYRVFLDLPFQDMSSGFRLYDRRVFEEVRTKARNFDIGQELLVQAYLAGFAVTEVPFHYRPRRSGHSHARLIRFGIALLRTAIALWKLRNERFVADYEARAFVSRNPLRRWWHRRRYTAVMNLVGTAPARVLDVGAGSSMRVLGLPQAIAVDRAPAKLRYVKRLGVQGVRASLARLPFPTGHFDLVIASTVLEHEPDDPAILRELARVLAPGGAIVIGTPDHSRVVWKLLHGTYRLVMPASRAVEHPTRYTRATLEKRLEEVGLRVDAVDTIAAAEVVVRAVKRA